MLASPRNNFVASPKQFVTVFRFVVIEMNSILKVPVGLDLSLVSFLVPHSLRWWGCSVIGISRTITDSRLACLIMEKYIKILSLSS